MSNTRKISLLNCPKFLSVVPFLLKKYVSIDISQFQRRYITKIPDIWLRITAAIFITQRSDQNNITKIYIHYIIEQWIWGQKYQQSNSSLVLLLLDNLVFFYIFFHFFPIMCTRIFNINGLFNRFSLHRATLPNSTSCTLLNSRNVNNVLPASCSLSIRHVRIIWFQS